MHAESEAEWIPAAVASDILDGTVVPATLPSGPIAVWRTQTGRLSANGDRCPHRGMRLSHGFVRGETLSCIYHGWRFGRDGSCEHIPAHPKVVPPKSINCGPHPVREQNGVAWVASTNPSQEPKLFNGYKALRSLVFSASPKAIAQASEGVGIEGGLQIKLDGLQAYLLLNARGPRDVFAIALIEADVSPPIQARASLALEAVRRKAEAEDALEISP